MFLVWRYLNFCSNFFSHAGKQLDNKAKVNSKIYVVANRETNHFNTHTQYLKK